MHRDKKRVAASGVDLVKVDLGLRVEGDQRFGQRRALRVVEALASSPASLSGLRPGDVVLAVDGKPLDDAQSLQRKLFAEAIGERMEITVLRNGALVDAVVVPTALAE